MIYNLKVILATLFVGPALIWAWVSKILGRSSLTVLLFHEVRPDQYQKLHKLLSILSTVFNKLEPSELNNDITSTKRGSSYLVTFDDGFKSSYLAEKEVLGKLGVKSIFFVCPAFIGGNDQHFQKFVRDNLYESNYPFTDVYEWQRPMSKDELIELMSRGNWIGSHSYSHRRLSKLNTQELHFEIVKSAQELSLLLEKPVSCFAFPFGSIESISSDALKVIASVYQHNFTGIRGVNNQIHHHAIWREAIDLNNPLLMNLAVALGIFRPIYYFKRKKYLQFLNEAV